MVPWVVIGWLATTERVEGDITRPELIRLRGASLEARKRLVDFRLNL